MFFAIPKVKSLSRYAEFGTYLGQKEFLMMLACAMVIHAVIIGIYALAPRQEVIRIPVRALNIKLSGGRGAVEMPGPQVQAPVIHAPVVQEIAPKPVPARPQRALKPPPAANPPRRVVTDGPIRPSRTASLPDSNLNTPKKYVRESDLAAEAKGQGGQRAGAAAGGGDAIIERYEQAISLWISRHRVYPEAARRQGAEGDAIVRIRIDRAGRIVYYAIDHSSGNAIIDDAVIAMVRASNPVPPAPGDYPDASQLEFLIPVSFRLQ